MEADLLLGNAGADKLDGGENAIDLSVDLVALDTSTYKIANADGKVVEVNAQNEIVAVDGSIYTIDSREKIFDIQGAEYIVDSNYDLKNVNSGAIVDLDLKFFKLSGDNIVDIQSNTYTGNILRDTADYSDEGAIYTTLKEGTYTPVNVSGGDSDQIKNIENIKGSNTGDDIITGDSKVNIIDGQGGNDTLSGGDNNDTVFGGAGDDTLRGGKGDDFLFGGDTQGNDTGSDTADYTDEGIIIVNLADAGTTSVDVDATDTDTLVGIENITGSKSGGDTIEGNINNNTLKGLKGDDTLTGGAGDDYLDGGRDNDTLYGGADQDTLRGSDGNDYLEGGSGINIIDGGNGGGDTASYVGAKGAVEVNLSKGTASGGGSTGALSDIISNIENVIGSKYKDTITGHDSKNTIFGGADDDTMFGEKGDDTLFGGEGSDTLSGGEGIDKLYGGEFDDSTPPQLIDTSPQDTASYRDVTSTIGIIADMTKDGTSTAAVSRDGYKDINGNYTFDYLYGIENIEGSKNNDNITGNSINNHLLGKAGKDILFGGGGNDTLDGGSQDDTLSGDLGNDTLLGGDGFDTADYSSSTHFIEVDLANYVLKDANGNYVVDNDNGNNVLNDGILINDNNTPDPSDDVYGQDRLVGIENIIGSDLSDTIIGDTISNIIEGRKGDDSLKGGSGLDTLKGGEGNDTLFGGADADTLDGGTNSDGSEEHDIVDYSDITANGVIVDLAAGTATGDGDDTLVRIEDIRGSDQKRYIERK